MSMTFKQYLINEASGSNRERQEVEQLAAKKIFDEAMELAYNEAADYGGGGVTHDRIAAIAAQLVHNEGQQMSQAILDRVNQMIEADFANAAT